MAYYKRHLHVRYAGKGEISIAIRVYDANRDVLAIVARRIRYKDLGDSERLAGRRMLEAIERLGEGLMEQYED